MAVGSPDHNLKTFPSHSTQGALQTRFIAVGGGTLTAGATGDVTITSGSTTLTTISVIELKSDKSGLQDLEIIISNVVVYRAKFDTARTLSFTGAGTLWVPPGTSLIFRLRNNLGVSTELHASFTGMTESV